VKAFQVDNPLVVKIAEEFFENRYLDVCAQNNNGII
jgi:hypothetical protein